MPIDIQPIADEHVHGVARLHVRYLSTPFSGRNGERLLRLYYAALVRQQGGCGFVALNDGQVVGYVCGVWDPKGVRKALLKASWLELLWFGAMQALKSPGIVKGIFERFNFSPNEPQNQGYELRPIVVSQGYQGVGVAGLLLDTLLVDARERGYASIHLFVEEDNLAAIRFYEKSGFVHRGERNHSGGIMRLFEKGTQSSE